MTDKVQKIREEVERLKGWNNNVRNSTRHMTLQEEDFNRGKHSSYLEILNFIDSLQEEPVSEDLEKAADEYADGENPTCPCEECLIKTFKAGAKWQKQIDDNTKRQIHKNAVEYGKSQMLNAACEYLIAHSLLAKPIIDDFRKALEED